MNPRTLLTLVLVSGALALPACSELKTDMKMDGAMKMDGNMTMKVEGPLEMNMNVQGPTITYKGTYISEKLLEEVQVDRTTGEWVLAVFGEPDERKKLSDGSEVWKWQYRPEEESAMAFSIFGDKDKPRTPQMLTFVQIRDGVVVRKFRD